MQYLGRPNRYTILLSREETEKVSPRSEGQLAAKADRLQKFTRYICSEAGKPDCPIACAIQRTTVPGTDSSHLSSVTGCSDEACASPAEVRETAIEMLTAFSSAIAGTPE